MYVDPGVTDVACAGLNGLAMGDRTLTVRRAAEVGAVGERGGRCEGRCRLLAFCTCTPHEAAEVCLLKA